MGLVFVGGINGVGKTSIVWELAKKLPIHGLNGSTELMRRLGILEGDYDYLRRIPEDLKNEALEYLFRDLAAESNSNKGTTVITGHYVKILDGLITPSLGSWWRHCESLVLVVETPRSILRRILRDEAVGARMDRSLFAGSTHYLAERVRFLGAAQDLSWRVMNSVSEEFGIPSFCIKNKEEHLPGAVRQLADIILGKA